MTGRSKHNKMISNFTGLILLVCAAFHSARITCYISAVAFIFYVINSIIIEKDRLFLKYIHVLFIAVEFLVGVFACDTTNTWLGEIRETTFYFGAFNILAFYYWIVFTLLGLIDPYFVKHTRRGKGGLRIGAFSVTKFVYRFSNIIIFVSGAILFLSVARHPSFASGAINRFEYSQQYISRFVNAFRVFPTLFACLIIKKFINKEILFNRNNVIKNVFVPYIPFFLFLIWTGNKFGSFKELIYLFVIPVMSIIDIKWNNVKKMIKPTVIVISTLVLILVSYYMLQGNQLKVALSLINIRIACQGELWWKLVAVVDDGTLRVGMIGQEISNFLKSIVTEGTSKNYGIYSLMNILGNPAVVKSYSLINTRFTSTGIELPFYYLRYYSFILVPAIICPLISWTTNYFVNATRDGRFVASIASARLLLLVMGAITQGDWYAFFSTIPLIFAALLIVSDLYMTRSQKVKRI